MWATCLSKLVASLCLAILALAEQCLQPTLLLQLTISQLMGEPLHYVLSAWKCQKGWQGMWRWGASRRCGRWRKRRSSVHEDHQCCSWGRPCRGLVVRLARNWSHDSGWRERRSWLSATSGVCRGRYGVHGARWFSGWTSRDKGSSLCVRRGMRSALCISGLWRGSHFMAETIMLWELHARWLEG